MMTTDIFASRLRAARKAKKKSQADVAEVCRNREGEPLSREAVAQWESRDPGKNTRPSFENLVEAARLLDTSIDYLVGLRDVDIPLRISTEAAETAILWDEISAAARASAAHAIEWAEDLESRPTSAIKILLEKVAKKRDTEK